jgi:hypothetical protein|tara:strand:- start:381 stop:560 length:180 start_codon:yes stop_codon:yes gene_type:complete
MADKKRARTKAGKFIADDPNTPENEAWVKTTSKSSNKKALPPKGSAEYKAMLLRGEIKE